MNCKHCDPNGYDWETNYPCCAEKIAAFRDELAEMERMLDDEYDHEEYELAVGYVA